MKKRIKPIVCLSAILIFSAGYATPKSTGLSFMINQSTDKEGFINENPGKSRWFWGFDKFRDREGWTLPDILNGTVSGGALWLTIQSEPKKIGADSTWAPQIWGQAPNYELVSPKGLMVPSAQYGKIVLRLRNLSPETDGFVRWQTTEKPGVDEGAVHFTMKPDCSEWQEVVCHMDNRWNGTIDQIKIQPAQMWRRGDIWIDWITIINGEVKKPIPRPDICSDSITPRIRIPGITQRDFHDAFNVLDECVITEVPVNGFNYPFLSPGGAYGPNWWQLDGSLNVAGAKWVNQRFAEDIIRGYMEVQAQNPDGRIDLWGGSTIRGEVGDVSSLPKFFEAAYDVARRTHDSFLEKAIYISMKKYLEYWFSSAKRNQETGLITGVFEETFSNSRQEVGGTAPIDLNVAVAEGCYNTSRLADNLGEISEAARYLNDFKQLSASINKYLWSNEDKKYYNYFVRETTFEKRLLSTTFEPFLLCIAPCDRVEKLIPVLLDPSIFNWGKRPVTSIAKTEKGYVEATGVYDGRGFLGDIWTMKNLPIINGLEDVGEHELAAELAWSTIKTFNANFTEYINTGTGSGEGQPRYGWTASQYIQAVIENLFGIDYDFHYKRLRITPHIPKELMNQEIEISNLIIPAQNELKLDLKVLQKKQGSAIITIKLEGKLPEEIIEVCLPAKNESKVTIVDNKGKKLQAAIQIDGFKNANAVRMTMSDKISVIFE